MGKDLISEVTCSEPYEWKDPTGIEWEFSDAARLQAGKAPFHVRLQCLCPTKTVFTLKTLPQALRSEGFKLNTCTLVMPASEITVYGHAAVDASDVCICCITCVDD